MSGEMTKEDLEVGGEFYEARLKLEEIVKKAGHNCTVLPFDTYQGPYAQVFNKMHDKQLGTLWLGLDDHEGFIYRPDSKEDGIEVQTADDLFEILTASYELFAMDIELIRINNSGVNLKADLKIEGVVWKNITLGRIPNKFDISLCTIDNDYRPYIEIESSAGYFDYKRVIYLND